MDPTSTPPEEEDIVPRKKLCTSSEGDSTQEKVVYKCNVCSQLFSLRKNLTRHVALQHNNERRFKCVKCGADFKRKDYLSKHTKSCGTTNKRQKRATCFYKGCTCTLFTKSSLIEHLKKEHGAKIDEPITKLFSSMEEFLEWKDMEEVRTFSYFSSNGGKGDGNKEYFYCQRDGSSRAHRKSSEPSRKTNRKRKIGQIKSDQLCIAKMNVKRKEDGTISATYFASHSHPLQQQDFRFQPPTRATNESIKNQIALGVPPSTIHQSLQPNNLQKNNGGERSAFSSRDSISRAALKQRCSKVWNKKHSHSNNGLSVFQCEEVEYSSQKEIVSEDPNASTTSAEKCYARINSNLAKLQGILKSNSLPPNALTSLDTILDEAVRKTIVSISVSEADGCPQMTASRK